MQLDCQNCFSFSFEFDLCFLLCFQAQLPLYGFSDGALPVDLVRILANQIGFSIDCLEQEEKRMSVDLESFYNKKIRHFK